MSLAHTPLPHAEHCLLRDRVSGLAGQHRDLSAMVRIVCDQITEESGHVRAKAFDVAVAVDGRLQNVPERSTASV